MMKHRWDKEMVKANCFISVLALIAAVAIGMGEFAQRSHATSTQQTLLKVTWRHRCPAGFGFCADFPYIRGSQSAIGHSKFDSATSVTGKLDNFWSSVYRNGSGARYCLKRFDPKCPIEESYFVGVFRSKYKDPWTALTSINGGVKNPRRVTVQGNLACSFAKGIYGFRGLTVYHHGLVYYLETVNFSDEPSNLSDQEPLYMERFLGSISFT